MPRSVLLDTLPFEVRSSLTQLGAAVRRARVRRSLPMADVAARCMITEPTLRKVERGDPSVSLGALAAALWVLGLQGRLATLLQVDPIGEELEDRERRIRARRPSAAGV